MPGPNTKHILLATLGGQPQVVTFTLDLLLQRNIPISEVIVLHPKAYPRLKEAITRLSAEFIEDRYSFGGEQRTIHFRQQVLRYYGNPIDDIVNEQTASGALDTISEIVQELKQQHYIIHFSITGGRRLMAFLSFSAALLHFEQNDQLLHLYTPQSVVERANRGTIMHVTPADGVQLIEVPFARATHPILTRMLNNSASTAIVEVNTQQRNKEHKRCQYVLSFASPRQREVLHAYADGLNMQQVAQKLIISLATLSDHNMALLSHCRAAWPDENIRDYHFIRAKFSEFFATNEV